MFHTASQIIDDALAIDGKTLVQALPFIEYQNGQLYIDKVACNDLAQIYGTPVYVYSKNALLTNYYAYVNAFSRLSCVHICYAVKSNSNLSILSALAQSGAGFDIVSIGELARVQKAGGDVKKTVFSGVGKTTKDISTALQAGIGCFNVEAISEIELIADVAQSLNLQAPIALRINPDVDAKTHPYISTGMKDNKFGIDHAQALDAYRLAKSLPNLDVIGIDCHIGSQLLDGQPFLDALDKLIELIDTLANGGIMLKHLDLGGGLGVRYIDENPISVQEFADLLMPKLLCLQDTYGLALHLEPGRNISANAGILLTQVDVLKQTAFKNFAIVNASMSELIRPALYQSTMAIIPANSTPNANAITASWDIVGTVCESSDFLAKNRYLSLTHNDLLAITGAGAYGFVMASNYNSRPRPAEVLCDNGTHKLIRHRETLHDLWRGELA